MAGYESVCGHRRTCLDVVPNSEDGLPCDKHICPIYPCRLAFVLHFLPREETCVFFLHIEDKPQTGHRALF